MGIGERRDLIAGLVVGSFAGFVIYQASHLPYFSEFGPGPGFLPIWLGTALFSLSLLLALRAVARPGSRGGAGVLWDGLRQPLVTSLGFMLAVALLNRLGFIVSFALLTFFLVFVMERRSLFSALSVTLGAALGFYLVFVTFLGVPLPVGPWGF